MREEAVVADLDADQRRDEEQGEDRNTRRVDPPGRDQHDERDEPERGDRDRARDAPPHLEPALRLPDPSAGRLRPGSGCARDSGLAHVLLLAAFPAPGQDKPPAR